MIDVLFLILSLTIVFFATLVVTLPNILHCALSLMAVLFGTAGIYILLHAEMVALAQIAVYIGGVIVFIIFAIFLTTRIGERNLKIPIPKTVSAAVLGSVAFACFYSLYDKHLSSVMTTGSSGWEDGSIPEIGKRLLDVGPEGFIVPFEVVSVLLLMTIIGAVVIARSENDAEAGE